MQEMQQIASEKVWILFLSFLSDTAEIYERAIRVFPFCRYFFIVLIF